MRVHLYELFRRCKYTFINYLEDVSKSLSISQRMWVQLYKLFRGCTGSAKKNDTFVTLLAKTIFINFQLKNDLFCKVSSTDFLFVFPTNMAKNYIFCVQLKWSCNSINLTNLKENSVCLYWDYYILNQNCSDIMLGSIISTTILSKSL